jgi:hypothetical protein
MLLKSELVSSASSLIVHIADTVAGRIIFVTGLNCGFILFDFIYVLTNYTSAFQDGFLVLLDWYL